MADQAEKIAEVLDEAKDLLRSVARLQEEVEGEDQHVRLCIVRTDVRSAAVMLESVLRSESKSGECL